MRVDPSVRSVATMCFAFSPAVASAAAAARGTADGRQRSGLAQCRAEQSSAEQSSGRATSQPLIHSRSRRSDGDAASCCHRQRTPSEVHMPSGGACGIGGVGLDGGEGTAASRSSVERREAFTRQTAAVVPHALAYACAVHTHKLDTTHHGATALRRSCSISGHRTRTPLVDDSSRSFASCAALTHSTLTEHSHHTHTSQSTATSIATPRSRRIQHDPHRCSFSEFHCRATLHSDLHSLPSTT